jgi:hypothetical protein
MTAQYLSVVCPAPVSMPRGARWFADAAVALFAGVRRLKPLQTEISPQTTHTPEDLLAWASRIEHTQPGFASDLRAAALRSSAGAGRS